MALGRWFRAAFVVSVAAGSMFAGVAAVSAATHSVDIRNFSFQPGTVSVIVGDTVTWENYDQVDHTATSDTGAFDAGTVSPGEAGKRSVTFTTAGRFTYHCEIHRSMKGTVVVRAKMPDTSTAPLPETPAPSDAPIAAIAVVFGVAGAAFAARRLGRASR